MNFNILSINEKIKEEIQLELEKLPQLRKDLDKLLWMYNYSLIQSDKFQVLEKIKELRKVIKILELNSKYIYFLFKTEKIIQKSRSLCVNKRSFIFVDDDKTHLEKKKLMNKFVRVIKEFGNFEIQGIDKIFNSSKNKCNKCKSTDFDLEDENIYTCKNCGGIIELLDDSPTFKDTDRVNLSYKYRYTKKGHFIDSMKRFQGKQNKTIPDYVFKILEKEFLNHNLTFQNISKKIIHEFLSDNHLTEFYEDLNLIYNIITKNPLPDISMYEKELLDMFDYEEKIYEEVKDPERQNSQNVDFKLFKLLQLLNYPCSINDDFFILKTESKLKEHDEKWGEIIDKIHEKGGDKNKWRKIATR